MNPDRPFTLVLSGGGLKGLAHIGVFRALEERGLIPSLVVGSSIGSLIGAAWAAGASVRQMQERARRVRRRDVFQVAHTDVALRRLLAPALYRREPLEALVRSLVGGITFRNLNRRLLVNTTDLHSGMQVLWGLPGLLDARVADAVVASCALPGIFPPRVINGRAYVDGAVVENLPVRLAAALGEGPVFAVNVAATSVVRSANETEGFAATYIRGLEIVMHTQIESQLRAWSGPPLVLVQPKVEHISMFAFDRTEELMEAGYRATIQTLDQLGGRLGAIAGGTASHSAASGPGGRRAVRGLRHLRGAGARRCSDSTPAERQRCTLRFRPGRRWMGPICSTVPPTRSVCARRVLRTLRRNLEDENGGALLLHRQEIAEGTLVVAVHPHPTRGTQRPLERQLVVEPLLLRRSLGTSPTGVVPTTEPPGARYPTSSRDQRRVVLDVLQVLAAVDEVELARPGRHRGEDRPRRRAAKPLGLGHRGGRDVVADRGTAELLQSQREDAVHAAEIEDPLPLGRIAAEQRALAPDRGG